VKILENPLSTLSASFPSAELFCISQRLSVALDASRWIAAALVLLSHINGRMFISFPMSIESDRSAIFYCWTFLCGFSHQAVMVFFVLSGFLVGGSYINGNKLGADNIKKYSVSRISRLYSVLLPALVLTLIIDYIGISASPLDGYVGDRFRGAEFGQVICNAVFLQTIICEPLGSNQPLWSLANEFWYYFIFPILVLVVSKKIDIRERMLSIAALVAVVLFLASYSGGVMILLYIHIWVLGVWAATTRKILIKNEIFAWGLFLLFLVGSRVVFRMAVWRDPYFGWILDTTVALLFSQALIATRFSPNSSTLHFARIHKWLSDRSYSVYAIHLPVLMVFVSICHRFWGVPWNGRPLFEQTLWSICITAATLGVCLIFHHVFEKRHLRLRDFILKGFNFNSHRAQPNAVSLENIDR